MLRALRLPTAIAAAARCHSQAIVQACIKKHIYRSLLAMVKVGLLQSNRCCPPRLSPLRFVVQAAVALSLFFHFTHSCSVSLLDRLIIWPSQYCCDGSCLVLGRKTFRSAGRISKNSGIKKFFWLPRFALFWWLALSLVWRSR